MLKKVKSVIEKEILLNNGQTVIVGLSGGADSICLTHILKRLGYNPVAVHIEHGIRGKEALSDAEFSKDFCEKNNIICFIEHINIPSIAKEKKISLETCGRTERYRIFNEYAKKYSCPIAVAHNKNDQAETVLLHLIRGSGLDGLAGMKYKTENIIRPLLSVSREEIEEYNKENNLSFVTDSTNKSDDYSRNCIRHKIIPVFTEINKNAINSVFQCSETVNKYKLFFDKLVDNEFERVLIEQHNNKITIKTDTNESVLREGIIRNAILLLNGNIVDIERTHVNSVLSLYSAQSGKSVNLPYGITVTKIYDTLEFSNKSENFTAEYNFIINKVYSWQNGNIKSEMVDSFLRKKDCEFVDLDKLPENLTLRTRQAGDFIVPLGMNGTVSLKEYFIDKKIPQNERNSLPLLCCGSEVFIILGKTVSEKVKIDSKTKKILKIYKE